MCSSACRRGALRVRRVDRQSTATGIGDVVSEPCGGLVVLDFSHGMPGAIATLVFADYGADVIKVEPPGGDPFRFEPGWLAWNRGKQGIVLDLATAEGRAEAAALAQKADVFIESMLPDDMADLGLDYDTLARSN